MASKPQLEKLVADVNECVVELLKDFANYQVPINDDNVNLHRFQEKIEFVLQYGIKEKVNILGSKKFFWDYIVASFSSLKRTHDGLKHIKSLPELNTSQGRGRAFLRFCLMYKCLADTVQTCFTNGKITNEYYNEKSIPMQKLLSSELVESLYDLNELNFDLISRHADLDICWPTFARKLFISSEDISTSSRNNSICSLSSQFISESKRKIDESIPVNSTEVDESLIHACLCQCDHENHRSCESAFCNTLKSEKQQIICSQDAELQIKYNKAAELQIKLLELENQELLRKVSELEYKLKSNQGQEIKENCEAPISLNCTENIIETKVTTKNYVECIKGFVIKQDQAFGILEKELEISINENNNLYSKICVLRDLLHSYGLLKAPTKTISVLNTTLNLSSTANCDINDEIQCCDNETLKYNECYDIESLKSHLNYNTDPVVDILSSALLKFRSLGINVHKLKNGIKSSQALSDNLLSRVKDQEIRLKGVTKELEEAQILVSVMKEQHQKLQSSEEIFKYDLQEKRKLMTKLKEQLESTREDWNRVRQKNSKSEAEWQDLRKEFVLRQKQASEESGFIDDKGYEESIPCNTHFDQMDVGEKNNIDAISEPCSVILTAKVVESPQPKTRLELLEEQCRLLHSNLLRNKSKRQELDTRLETICKGIDLSANKKETLKINSSTEHSEIDSGECCSPTSLEECVREDFNEESLAEFNNWNEIQMSSEIGSLNSDYSSLPHALCTETNSLDDCSSEIPDTDLCLPCTVSCCEGKSEQTNEIKNSFLNTDKDSSSALSFSHGSECLLLLNYDENFQHDNLVAKQSIFVEEYKTEDIDNNHNLTQVDSLLIKKKDLEKCLEHLQMPNRNSLNDSIRNFKQERKAFVQEIFVLKNEKELLKNEVGDLRNKLTYCEMQLDELAKQLATKEQEVTTLHFQLNTETLKYGNVLKKFQENDEALNDMKQKISDQEQLICAFEDALTEKKMEKENEDKHGFQELKDLKVHSQQDRVCLEAKLECLHSDSKDLKKQLVSLLNDEGKAKSLPKDSYSSDETFKCSENEITSGNSVTVQYSTAEIKENKGDVSGELIVNAGMICRFSILNENPPNDLYWSFMWNSEPVLVSLMQESHNECQQCQIHNKDHKMEDNAKLLSSGVYLLHIINSSRVVQELKYTLKIKDSS